MGSTDVQFPRLHGINIRRTSRHCRVSWRLLRMRKIGRCSGASNTRYQQRYVSNVFFFSLSSWNCFHHVHPSIKYACVAYFAIISGTCRVIIRYCLADANTQKSAKSKLRIILFPSDCSTSFNNIRVKCRYDGKNECLQARLLT